MGRPLGAFDSDELDRPDLNKCPDCGCFFATDACTLCGKVCPEEMRAGNRAAVKHKKRKSGGYTGRVQFISWYHRWWFIALMVIPVPWLALILFVTSPYSRKTKVFAAVGLVVLCALYFGVGAQLLNMIFDTPLVNDDISRAEYVELCTEMTADQFYRHAVNGGEYVTMELTVVGQLPSSWFYDSDDVIYYRCRSTDGTTDVVILDCILQDRQILRSGDMIRVWGESAGMMEFYPNYERTETLPVLYTAYCDLIG